MKRAVLVALLCLVYATTSLAQAGHAGFEFNGQLYPSFDAVIAAAQATSRTVADVPLMCGPRMTPAVLERGHYDLRLDTMVCFTSEEESDRLYAANRRLEASYRAGARPRIVRDVVTNSHHHVCDETARGTPFRYFAYNTVDDVCPSRPAAHIVHLVSRAMTGGWMGLLSG